MEKKHSPYFVYKLYEEMTDEEKRRFMKRFGLFHALFLDPDFEAKLRNVNKLVRYDVNDQTTRKMLFNLERTIRNDKRVALIDSTALFDRTVSESGELYDVINRTNDTLVLTKVGADKQKAMDDLKERKESGFCDSDLFAVDWLITKSTIPKLLDAYRRKTKHVPDGISPEEWDTILRDIVWFCNEYVCEFKNKGTEKYEERMAQAKKSFVEHFMDLL